MSANARNAVRLTVAGSLVVLGAACDQPAPKCAITRGVFAASYTLVSGTGDCATLHGEPIAIGTYNEMISESDKQPNPNKVSIAIQPSTLTGAIGAAAGLAEPDAADHAYAMGSFTGPDPDKDFCTVPMLSTARVRIPAIPEQMDMCTTTPAQPAVDISYTWSNVRVYVVAGASGTQLSADLTYTLPGCSAQYKVTAVYPSVSCGAPVVSGTPAPATGDLPDGGVADASAQGMDAAADMDSALPEADGSIEGVDSDGACPPAVPAEPAPVTVADDTLCSPDPDLSKGRVTGSGINSDFATRCEPTTLLCVLKADPPSLK